jgi:hypothetical protein
MSYQAEIIAAITMLKERNGSCIIAIKKTVQASRNNESKCMNAMFLATLKKMVTNGILIKNKSRYKLGSNTKKAPLLSCNYRGNEVQKEVRYSEPIYRPQDHEGVDCPVLGVQHQNVLKSWDGVDSDTKIYSDETCDILNVIWGRVLCPWYAIPQLVYLPLLMIMTFVSGFPLTN